MKRRSVLLAASASPLAGLLGEADAETSGRLKQSAARWCYAKMSLEDLCKNGARIGLKGLDLVNHDEWPTLQKYGLTPAMTPGAGTIPNAWNRKENHDVLEKEMRENIQLAAAAKVPNVITFSGNRRGMPDEEAKDNCVTGLNRVKRIAEDKGVTICVWSLLNSKVQSQGLPVRSHRLGCGSDEARGFAPGEAAVRHLPHANHGRRHYSHHHRQHPVHCALPHRRRTGACKELDDTQELNWRTDRQGHRGPQLPGILRARVCAGARSDAVAGGGRKALQRLTPQDVTPAGRNTGGRNNGRTRSV